MKIINELITKKIENEHFFLLNLKREFAYGEYICAYLHSLFFLIGNNLLTEDQMQRNFEIIKKCSKLWKKFTRSSDIDRQLKIYKKMLKFHADGENIILMALNKIEELKYEGDSFGSLYQPFTWGMIAYQHEANI